MNGIDGLRLTPLSRIPDERGAVFHMLRSDWDVYEGFGEVYFSLVYPNVVKAWHLHKRMTLNYAVPIGMIKLVCYDDREGSSTRGNLVELFVGELNYQLVTLPPMVWNGFKGVGTTPALVANCTTEVYADAEIVRMPPSGLPIPYDWAIKHG